ncbi:cytochrome c553 [Hoeflea halophila]|uniref:Cytochrome c553 n=1 Tax=Hoeflea halophila TaxID=714899 RepID=A0A286IBY0_9HYPH|nr:c-type cytochrome [Hoeflea halophila]SOE17156.1 cytochrome c553 [Hoeflea halophila]
MRVSVLPLVTVFMAFAAGAETPPALFDGDEANTERTPATALGRVIASGGAQRGGVGMKCMACHGLDDAGAGLGDIPGLAGQPAKYLVDQLKAFMSGDRISPIMVPIAMQLGDAEREAVSDYYASAAPKMSKFEHGAPAEKVQLGGALAASGSDTVTACSQCHGGDETSGAAIPRLSGQSAQYIADQLIAWREGERANGPLNVMEQIAKSLSPDEIEAVALYYQQTPPDVQ